MAVPAFSLTFDEFKDKYRPVTSGDIQLTKSQSDLMFSDFLVAFAGEKEDTRNMEIRKAIFDENVQKIIAHNRDSTVSWKKGINAYTDMTDDEFMAYFGLSDRADQNCSATASPIESFPVGIPTDFDWRRHDAVTPVKNQGKCGSCWTFSTVGAMESHYFLRHHKNGNFSEQQLVDCAGNYDCHGCRGGLPSYAFNYIRDNGMTNETAYPYHALDEKCYYNHTLARVTTVGPYNITAYNETQLAESIFWRGPVSVAFQVVNGFKDYESGVYNSTVCKNGPMDVNHAVLAVGYGLNTTSGLESFSIKNSWGASWGNKGFFDIQRGVNMCGIGVCNSYPLDVHEVRTQTFEYSM
eukprot:CAMPEP_0168343396 /NCGR_PEP_ID=MMETSP0213-20121227/16058_1 /TAXON_ID=151035 /ORGANISM="Euplotes harpa, Strain FSP1.4" /LENGTH=351 /DNA_ID=CAMNT_0008350663 /DNA_START=33 /DNA_END=1088 /DNA_ORIENTATION=+